MAHSFLETGKHSILAPGFNVDDPVRCQPGLGERRGKQILPDDAPEHRTAAPCRNPG